ncbi:RNA 2',3'-cyclic phosphodiesterase [Georgenia alba]|uniref:RNA 2',3'-cyclic phosphodiesterase n=1 Tax=Georgenia alba TaxID=2233858 RepID=A0ABW2Q9Q2_9MICO
MRLFVCLPLPDQVAGHLDLAVQAVTTLDPAPAPGAGRPALRWLPAEQRHITLAFYGEVADGAVDDLTADLTATAARFAPPSLRLHGAGVFSGRTLWVGVQHEEPRGHSAPATLLTDLMAACEDVGERFVPQLERRGRHRAHVTLARSRDPRRGDGELRRRSRALAVYAGPVWSAGELLLVRSELGAGKGGSARHTTLAEIPLGGDGRARPLP